MRKLDEIISIHSNNFFFPLAKKKRSTEKVKSTYIYQLKEPNFFNMQIFKVERKKDLKLALAFI